MGGVRPRDARGGLHRGRQHDWMPRRDSPKLSSGAAPCPDQLGESECLRSGLDLARTRRARWMGAWAPTARCFDGLLGFGFLGGLKLKLLRAVLSRSASVNS